MFALKKTAAPSFGLAVGLALALMQAQPAKAEPVTFALDKAHSNLVFNIDHLGYSKTWGRFGEMDATLMLDQENPAKSSIELVVDAVSVDTNHLKRDNHLRSPDFLSVREFPTITFVSTSVEPTGETTAKVTGDLTMHGITKPITLNVTMNKLEEHPMMKVPAVGFSSELTLDRTDFGVATFAPAIGSEMRVFIDLEFIKER